MAGLAEIFQSAKVSTSYIDVADLGKIKLFRRRGLKNIRLSINNSGEIRLSIPWYVPKTAGIKYLRSKKDWIKKHRIIASTEWTEGQHLINGYRLSILSHQKKRVATVIEKEILHIFLPEDQKDDAKRQSLDRHVTKFLKTEAEKTLLPMVMTMATRARLKPKKVRIKNLKSRWGSCSQDKVITLNLSLLRLPDELVEYVIFHELVHTRHLNHSKSFWQDVEALLPDYKRRRKTLKTFNIAGVF